MSKKNGFKWSDPKFLSLTVETGFQLAKEKLRTLQIKTKVIQIMIH